MKPVLVVFTGAGISAESGIQTFRGAGGLWEGFDVMEVASIMGYKKNPKLVQRFYNQRRAALELVVPNKAHFVLAGLESNFEVLIITQNVDNLHERAGSTKVLHLHGELTKACSSIDKSCVVEIGYKNISDEDKALDGSPLRPFIVWFGEEVPLMEKAYHWLKKANAFAVIGSSLQVYPAANLIYDIPSGIPKWLVDPDKTNRPTIANFQCINQTAVEGLPIFEQELKKKFSLY